MSGCAARSAIASSRRAVAYTRHPSAAKRSHLQLGQTLCVYSEVRRETCRAYPMPPEEQPVTRTTRDMVVQDKVTPNRILRLALGVGVGRPSAPQNPQWNLSAGNGILTRPQGLKEEQAKNKAQYKTDRRLGNLF
jgi:hypothetical protein